MKRNIMASLILFLMPILSVTAQNKTKDNSSDSVQTVKVETVNDEFSGRRKVTLKDLPIAQNLLVSLSAAVDLKKSVSSFDRFLEYSDITFVSSTGKRVYGSIDNRFDFLVDGKRVEGSLARSSPTTDDMFKDNRELVIGMMDLNRLAQVSVGRKVQLKIGENVFDLSSEALLKFKEFVAAAH